MQAGNAAGRAAAELAEFQNRQMLDDIDPDAPAAMKASPSVSGESGAGMHLAIAFNARIQLLPATRKTVSRRVPTLPALLSILLSVNSDARLF